MLKLYISAPLWRKSTRFAGGFHTHEANNRWPVDPHLTGPIKVFHTITHYVITFVSAIVRSLATWVVWLKLVTVGGGSMGTLHGDCDELDVTRLVIPGLVTKITPVVGTLIILVGQELAIVLACFVKNIHHCGLNKMAYIFQTIFSNKSEGGTLAVGVGRELTFYCALCGINIRIHKRNLKKMVDICRIFLWMELVLFGWNITGVCLQRSSGY